ncbi:MAG: phosphate ABC transporter substrate-binding protein PstS [Deltaproteobacteria bacterium]|nr:phosphate ABC transporter substrate-binding protein PstS [Deltaproteobacteria bacterium]
MKKTIWLACILAVGLALAPAAQGQPLTLNGAGATFPYPVYSQWAFKYHKTTGVKINYQSIGSGGGIAQINAKTVDFGASDEPLKPEDLEKSGLVQFPMLVGGVVPVVNVPGVAPGQMRLTADILAQIFLGRITRWDDPAIKKLNDKVDLPALNITVVRRADGSGTTWIFTSYLAKLSPEWQQQVGAGKAVSWPTGVGAKGNEGVAAYVQRVKGAIGYVEYAYALQNKMTYTLLENRAARFVAPEMKSFQAAAANAEWAKAPGYYLVLIDQPGEDSWPITGATFILLHKTQADAAKARALLKFFDWCYRHGAEIAQKLDYVPIPPQVVDLVQASWAKEIKADGKPVWPQ